MADAGEDPLITDTLEDYLKGLLVLSTSSYRDGSVPLGKLAGYLKVSPGTVTTMVKRFTAAGWMEYFPRRGCTLTSRGKTLALQILKKHRLVETFLVTTLGLNWSEVHEEAERLEHALSEKVIERLDHFLGYPQMDPHGKVIPRSVRDLNDDGSS